MIKNYIKVAFRNILKQKAYSFINVFGLAIGLSCCILISVYVFHELSYDRFHEKASHIYRAETYGKMGERNFRGITTPAPFARVMVEEFPEVMQATRLYRGVNTSIRYQDNSFLENHYYYVDSTFFDVFSFELIKGNPETVLDGVFSAVITESTARKYFGDEDPIGKTLRESDGTDLTVRGVAKDCPENSHFHFDILVSLHSLASANRENWLSDNWVAYFVMDERANIDDIEAKMPDFLKKHYGPQLLQALGVSMEEWFASGNSLVTYFKPLKDIYLHSDESGQLEPVGNASYVFLMIFIALFILLLAVINFTNLTTAKASSRAKEVGLRKVVGSGKSLLITQFLAESVFLTFIAMIMALILSFLLLPAFGNLAERSLSLNLFSNWFIIPVLLAVTLFVGLLAGSYTSMVLSSFSIQSVLKGKIHSGKNRSWFRSGLVVFQFGISIGIIVSTIVVYTQINFMLNKDLGFEKEGVVVVDRAYGLGDQLQAFKQELQKNSSIQSVSAVSALPGAGGFNGNIFQRPDSPSEEMIHFRVMSGDFDMLETLGMKMADGRYFSSEYSGDSTAYVINESAAKSLGYPKPVGEEIAAFTGDQQRSFHNIIGVIKDFHILSMRDVIENVMITFPGTRYTRYVACRIEGDDARSVLKFLEEKWGEFVPEQPFKYFFLDDSFAEIHQTEIRTGKLFGIFSILAILIASLGLLGLASFMAEQKTKEIGVRKVMGSSSGNIIIRFSSEFVKWVLIANVIAWPAAYFLMRNWLNHFHYRIDLGLGAFVIAALIALVIALLTVSAQTFKAANKNPAEALRYE